MPAPETPPGSMLLVEEFFAAGNDAFLSELRKVTADRALAPFADRWKIDPRPWARRQILAYLDEPLATPGHNVLVKRLYKQAEQVRDHELMAAFLTAFDCLVRRARTQKWIWDLASRQSYSVEILSTPKNNLLPPTLPGGKRAPGNPFRRRRPESRLFSYRTRYYLRRRVWRYFRYLAYRSPETYPAAVCGALARYSDADLARGENLLDSWCLLHICCHNSPALTFTPSQVRLNDGHTLNDLAPAPKLPDRWTTPAAAAALWDLLPRARSRFVRLWAIALLKQHHTAFLSAITPERLFPLFDTFDDELQQLAGELLEKSPALPALPLDAWLQLLNTKNPTALATLCDLMLRHVTPERLSLPQTITLTTAAPAPVARLGLIFLRARTIAPAGRLLLSDLAHAKAQALAGEITAYALSILGAPAAYDVALVSRFFDALLAPTRAAAWSWLTPDSPGYNDPALWLRLLETPYEDVRLRLVAILQKRAGLPGTSADQLVPIWTAVLLGIHRGGRHKIIALNQISRALIERPADAEKLLPIVAVAIRSVRPAEARVGLAAVVHALDRQPALAETAARLLPELRLVSQGATA